MKKRKKKRRRQQAKVHKFRGVIVAILTSRKLREMNGNELVEKLREFRLEVSKEIASSAVGGTVKNSGRIREAKRTIARILTIQNERRAREVEK